MTTAEIIAYADPEGLSVPDVNLNAELRLNLMPDFLEAVGYVSWRRKHGSAVLSPGDTTLTLPANFYSLKAINLGGPNDPFAGEGGLGYIGDNPDLVLAAENATVAAKPSGYYFQEIRVLKFGAPLDATYTARYVYYSGIIFADLGTEVELDDYIPLQHQWALVEGLRKILYARRFGVGDNRFADAAANYDRKVDRASANREKTSSERPRFVN